MRAFARQNGLTLFFLAILALALAGKSVAGLAEFNAQQTADGLAPLGYLPYLTSSDFATDVAENWQSEFLQFTLYILATVYLVQQGSSESKEPGRAGLESDAEQKVGEFAVDDSPSWARRRGWRLAVYSRSLTLVMAAIFAASWAAQSIAGRAAYNADQLGRLQDPVSWFAYATSADFWSRTLQNWQSEFLAVASMAVFAVYLRQRGSPESKPVGTPHRSTGTEE
jgi:anti-sigma-K factor RskA